MYTQDNQFLQDPGSIQDTWFKNNLFCQYKNPENMMAVMSAANPQEQHSENSYNFEMKQPIPPYLIAWLGIYNLKQLIIEQVFMQSQPCLGLCT